MKYLAHKLVLTVCILVCSFLQLSAQKIGFLLDGYVTDRWYMDEKLFSDKVEDLGGTCLVKSSAYGEADEQLELAKRMIDDAHVDVLVVVPSDAHKAAAIAAYAKAKNVPLVAYDRLILSNDVSIYVSYDNKKVGMMQAKYALKEVPKGSYLLVNGPPSDNNAILYREGQLEVLKPQIEAGNITIMGDLVLESWSGVTAFMETQEFLSTQKERPDVILAANDAVANSCIESVKTFDEGDKTLITGQDADISGLKNILKGYQAMTVYKSIKSIANVAAETAMKLADNKKVTGTVSVKAENNEVDAILLEPVVVDKNNYKETVVKDGHITLAEMLKLDK